MQFAAFLMLVFMLEAVIGVMAYLYEAAVRSFATFASLTLVSDDYAPQRAGHASLPGPTALLVTRAFAAAGPGLWNSSTHYRHFSEMLTYRTVGSGGH